MGSAQLSHKTDWQRLAPISIIHFIFSSMIKFVHNALFLIPIVAINFTIIKEQPHVILAAALTLFTLIGLVNYFFYWFKVTTERIEIKHGIFKKSHIILPFERIQNIKLSQPFYYRISDYSCIELDTAGSAKQEAKIVALKTSQAKQLRITILENAQLKKAAEQKSQESEVQHCSATEIILNRRSLKDLVIHGVTNNRIWIFFLALGPFYNSISASSFQLLNSIGIDVETYFNLQNQAWWEIGLHLLSLTVLILVVFVLLSVLSAIFMFYQYTLSQSQDRYIRRSGWLTKYEVSMNLSRIQLMIMEQNWLNMLLGRANLSFEQNSSGAMSHNNSIGQMASKLLIPSITAAESFTLMKNTMPNQALDTQTFNAISKRFIWRGVLLIAVPISVFLLAVLPTNGGYSYLISTSVLVLISALVALRWQRWGYSVDGDYIYIRQGLFGINYYCFPIYKAQQVKFVQSIFMRASKLGALQVVLASGQQKIPYMPADEVRAIVNGILDRLVHDKRSWM